MITVAVVGFTVLTAAAVTARLDAVGTVEANFRPAFDILIRPQGSALELERQRNLVQSGQLAGLRGGITDAQWREIQGVQGVAVAAPVAVIGYIMRTVPVRVELGGDLDPALERQVLRVQPTWVTDAGLSRIPDGPAYLYATRNLLYQKPLSQWRSGEGAPPPVEFDPDGRRTRSARSCRSSARPTGSTRPTCRAVRPSPASAGPAPATRWDSRPPPRSRWPGRCRS